MSRIAPGEAHTIEASLEEAAARCADLTPLVYARLFAEHPEMERLFWRDKSGAIKGEMLSKVFEIILDFIGDNRYAAHMIQCEVMTHSGYDVPPEVFRVFFGVVAATLRDVLGKDWTSETDAAWQTLLRALDFFVLNPDQYATAAAS